ncbi:MAG: hypothetical protein WCA08_08965 [Desulfoferrobacter sp.]
MFLVWVLIPCLVCGVFFAFIAAWLTTKKGNTISDILNSQKMADAEAIKLEILDKIKLTSTVPIVALFVVSIVVAIGLPALLCMLMLKDVNTITLRGVLKKEPSAIVYVTPKEMQVEPSGDFVFPLVYTNGVQTINIEGEHYQPITLIVTIDKLKNLLQVEIGGDTKEIPVQLGSKSARFEGEIHLYPVDTIVTNVRNEPTERSPTKAEYQNVGSPPEVK